MSKKRVPRKTTILWAILYLDTTLMFLRYGGLAVVDLMIHAGLLLIAGILLARHRHQHAFPPILAWSFAAVIGVCLVQLVPIPAGLAPLLAPVKHRIIEATAALFPEIAWRGGITILPDRHLFKLASLLLDMYLIYLVIRAPRAGARLFQGWLLLLFTLTGVLAVLGMSDRLSDGFLHVFVDTYGGLVNPNHYAYFNALALVVTAGEIIIAGRVLFRKQFAVSGKWHQLDALPTLLAFSACFLLLAGAFALNWSRSGLVNFAVVLIVFPLAYFLLHGRSVGLSMKALAGVGAVVLLLLALIPFTRGFDKFSDQGFSDNRRLNYHRIGFSYLAEFPLLGTGLASSESLLTPMIPRELYDRRISDEFHDDFLQTAVELGPIGLAALLILLGWTLRRLLEERERHSRAIRRDVVLAVFVCTALYSVISFPLRITALRTFVILLTARSLKDNQERAMSVGAGMAWLPPLLPLVVLVFFAYLAMRTPTPEQQQVAGVERAMRYGQIHKPAFLHLNQDFRGVLLDGLPPETAGPVLADLKQRAVAYLAHQPFDMNALNIRFMVEALEESRAQSDFDPERYARLKAKAVSLADMTNHANMQSLGALFFLYSMYEPYLDEEERAQMSDWREGLGQRIRREMREARDAIDQKLESEEQ